MQGCVLGVGARLSGTGAGFNTNDAALRPWWLVGAGPKLVWQLQPRVALGLSGYALAALSKETFSVESRGVGYETDRVTGLLAAELRLRFW